MINFLNSNCQTPMFLVGKQTAGMCGLLKGLFMAIILSIVVIVLVILIYRLAYNSNLNLNENRKRMTKYLFITVAMILLILVVVSCSYMLGNITKWRSYQALINSYQAQGYDKIAALNKTQDLYQTEIQARAIRKSR